MLLISLCPVHHFFFCCCFPSVSLFFCSVDDFQLLSCLLCGGFTRNLRDAVLWFSSGGTKSVLHNDGVDNINCLMSGSKDIFLFDKVATDNSLPHTPAPLLVQYLAVPRSHAAQHHYTNNALYCASSVVHKSGPAKE